MSTTIYDILTQLRTGYHSERAKGDLFERLMLAFLKTDPQYQARYAHVWKWMDWPGRDGKADSGIDLVAEDAETGELCAIQCKFYEAGHKIQKPDVDSFLSESGKQPFRQRMIITTAPLGNRAEEALRNQQIPVETLDLDVLERSPIDWQRFSWDQPESLPSRNPKVARPHQVAAIKDVKAGFETVDRGKLIMACGTGKTFTALKLVEEMVPAGGYVLFLVPSISLLSQSLREWTAESGIPMRSFAVCSDAKVGKNEDSEDLKVSDLAYPATTNATALTAEVTRNRNSAAVTVIFSTYQSIEVVIEAQRNGVPAFDIVICDEAHRTSGVVTYDQESHFLRVHSPALKTAKRLYMTATPRIFAEKSKTTAREHDVEIFSMDDPVIYGPEFHRLNFSKAVEAGILSDYKVIILAVDQDEVNRRLGKLVDDPNNPITPDDAAKLVGCWNGLAKRFPKDEDGGITEDLQPMRRAVAFSNTIKNSKKVVQLFQETVEAYRESLDDAGDLLGVAADHVDGTFNVTNRNQLLNWLKEEHGGNVCRILSNARCLTEGVDVPALDAVMFLNPRDSQVDVVQAVGRVMRRAPGKEYGYVILPIVIPSGDEDPAATIARHPGYRVVWQVLNALRAHDDRFNDIVNKLELNKKKPKQLQIIGVGGGGDKEKDGDKKKDKTATKAEQLVLDLTRIETWREAIYAKIVEKCGERIYWETWAKDVAKIAADHQAHIKTILSSGDPKADKAFATFLKGLKKNLNDSIDQNAAVEMLSQHLVTKPVFDALFGNYGFSGHNPVSKSMEKVIRVLEDHALWKETESLEPFYADVRRRAAGLDNPEARQRVIVELYDKFFRTAFPKMAERLGIVYTPVEIVDFILHSVEHVLKTEFGASLSDNGVHILDPFTGTGTFIVRLLQSGLIKPEDLMRKYRYELHANEIVLLAYYIAAINIEEAFHRLAGDAEYVPYKGILLTDTFNMGKRDAKEPKQDLLEDALPENSEAIERQNRKDIRVIVGNPPYSAGQESEDDKSKNLKYPKLDERIKETYAALATSSLKKTLYASEIRALRWASDRVGNEGIVAFVTNGSFINSGTADGIRLSLEQECDRLYVFNLRGNQRTSGEASRREGGKIFGSGSRNTIAIILLVKKLSHAGPCDLLYNDIGDYLDREHKLSIVSQANNVSKIEWDQLHPNQDGDWVNQRDNVFGEFMALGSKKATIVGNLLFRVYSFGVITNRDPWVYNFNRQALATNVAVLIDNYGKQIDVFRETFGDNYKKMPADIENSLNPDRRLISWTRSLISDCARNKPLSYEQNAIRTSLYRPFTKEYIYLSRRLNEMVSLVHRLFPISGASNMVILIIGVADRKGFSCLIADQIPNMHTLDTGQAFPLYDYVDTQISEGNHLLDGTEPSAFTRRDAITDTALNNYSTHYADDTITKEDIFYHVYGLLHSPEYRTRFASDLKKMLPRIPMVSTLEDFRAFSQAGRDLAHWHLNYETIEPWPCEEIHRGEPGADQDEFYRVEKMRFGKAKGGGKEKDKSTVIYNSNITISGIPLDAYDYVVNGRPAIEWIIDRYQVTVDKDSGIRNDPNDWSDDPRYIVDLLMRVVRVSVETNRIVGGLPGLGL